MVWVKRCRAPLALGTAVCFLFTTVPVRRAWADDKPNVRTLDDARVVAKVDNEVRDESLRAVRGVPEAPDVPMSLPRGGERTSVSGQSISVPAMPAGRLI